MPPTFLLSYICETIPADRVSLVQRYLLSNPHVAKICCVVVVCRASGVSEHPVLVI